MDDDTEVLLAFCQEQWTQARHTEDQRATISNLIIVISSVILGFVSQQGFNSQMLPLTILLMGLGLFGAFVSEKLYERFRYHHAKARHWQNRINELRANAQLNHLEHKARIYHSEHKQWVYLQSIPLHYLWLVLHLAIAAMGVILTILIFAQM